MGEFSMKNIVAKEYRELTLPQGVFHWAGRAGKEAEINATIGTAMVREKDFTNSSSDKMTTAYLPSLHKILRDVKPGAVYPYAPIEGLPAFRKNWKKWVMYKADKRRKIPEELVADPIVVPGVTSGLHLLGKLFLSPGDSVVCADSRWENYDLLFEDIQKVRIVSHRLFDGDSLDAASFGKALLQAADADGKIVAVLNFPNNPTGYMPSNGETKQLVETVMEIAESGKTVILILDDAYDGFVYDPAVHRYSIFPEFVNLHRNIFPIKVDGVSKEFLFYGGRVACITAGLHDAWGEPKDAAAEFADKIAAMIRGRLSNCSRMVQEAVAAALDDSGALDKERETIRAILARRWEKLNNMLSGLPDFYTVDPFNSGFFCMINFKGVEAPDMADHLLKQYKVGTVAWQNKEKTVNGVRAAFCSVTQEQIPRLVESLAAAAETIKK